MFLDLPYGRMSYATYGDKKSKAVIFIHGFPFDKSIWDEQSELLSKDHFVVTYDIRGHGQSEVGSGQFLIEFFVDDLFAVMDHTQLKNAVVCGLSMGGYIALRGIDREPTKFSGLILCDTKSSADTNAAKLNRANQIKTILSGKKSQFAEDQAKALFAPESFERNKNAVEKITAIMKSTEEAGLVGALIALASRMDMTESLEKISVPTLIMVGDKDKVTPPSEAEMMNSRIKKSKLVLIHGAGHLSNLENSKEFNSALLEFLKQNNL